MITTIKWPTFRPWPKLTCEPGGKTIKWDGIEWYIWGRDACHRILFVEEV